MNNQEIFDTVLSHMRKQKVKSSDVKNEYFNNCLYRDSKGNKCAIGCLIPDELYDPKMDESSATHNKDGTGVSENKLVQKVLKKHLNIDIEDSMNLLMYLQTIHDKIAVEWSSEEEEAMMNLAESLYLRYTPVGEQ